MRQELIRGGVKKPYQGEMVKLIRWGMKNIPSLSSLRKGGADIVNTLPLPPFVRGESVAD